MEEKEEGRSRAGSTPLPSVWCSHSARAGVRSCPAGALDTHGCPGRSLHLHSRFRGLGGLGLGSAVLSRSTLVDTSAFIGMTRIHASDP